MNPAVDLEPLTPNRDTLGHLAETKNVDLSLSTRVNEPAYKVVSELSRLLVTDAKGLPYTTRTADFTVWIVGHGCEPEVALDVISGLDQRWLLGPESEHVLEQPIKSEVKLYLPKTLARIDRAHGPHMFAELYVKAKVLARLGQMRGSHQFGQILELLHGVSAGGLGAGRIDGFRWFAALGGGFEPLTSHLVDILTEMMRQSPLRESSVGQFAVVNGLFLAPPSRHLPTAEYGRAIERCLRGQQLLSQGCEWDGSYQKVEKLSDFGELGSRGPSAVTCYFFARAFRLQCRFEESMEAIDAAFNGLGGSASSETLMVQLEREREAIRLARDFYELVQATASEEDRTTEITDGLSSEDANRSQP